MNQIHMTFHFTFKISRPPNLYVYILSFYPPVPCILLYYFNRHISTIIKLFLDMRSWFLYLGYFENHLLLSVYSDRFYM